MKKSLFLFGSMFLMLPLFSFTDGQKQPINLVNHQNQFIYDAGWFYKDGQAYHAYTNTQYGTVVALYRSPGEGNPDGTAVTTFSGYTYDKPGYAINITFTDGTSKMYNDLVTY
ncbi:hypothetical protein GWR56_05380 [Mucilaginibacter sp. 14171R-50]|uniref:hypothetical protein n=1 Tax=Mucilaginibacter sp. 14171R-50 TaxID=2703789 RepID=UPI00138B3E58|nr:hypothetical protein [Mucilaginibacter sp. 14171R-50]QHS54998.1 hypothetical protein GWR56_05380 [Mucilaginibacter sp. 14171R-50]